MKSIKTLIHQFIVLFCIYLSAFSIYSPTNLYSQTSSDETISKSNILKAFVYTVVDGDTICVEIGGSNANVRLIGIDCPELSSPEEKFYAKKSLRYTKQRLLHKEVWLEFDVQKTDRYGRLLAYVWLKAPNDFSEEEIRESMFNAQILLDGYAKVYTFPPNVKYTDFFVKFQREAINEQAGFWKDVFFKEDTSDYYIGNKNSKVFHRPTCEWGQKIAKHNRIEFKTKIEAILQGFRACRNCKP